MGEIDDLLNVSRKKLVESLGDKEKEYMYLLKMWFKMKVTKKDFDRESRKILSTEQMHYHNQFILQLLNKCALDTQSDLGHLQAHGLPCRKKYSSFEKSFEPVDPTRYITIERQDIQSEPPQFLRVDGLLPDQHFMLARIMYGAWELGLDGTTTDTADLLVIATHMFLKNILTSVIGYRRNFKCNGKFICGVGKPTSNPWLRNKGKRKSHLEGSGILKCSPSEANILTPFQRRGSEEIERESAFQLASSDAGNLLYPICLQDLVSTIEMSPSLLASSFVYSVNMERMIARISHPSWND